MTDTQEFFRRVIALKRLGTLYAHVERVPMDHETRLELGTAINMLSAEYLLAAQDYFLDLESKVKHVKNIIGN